MSGGSEIPVSGGKPMYYRLDGHEPVPATRDEMVVQFEQHEQRRVAFTKVGEADVSTVFLVLDHNWGDGPPLLFETMVFGVEATLGEPQWRYATWDEAEAGHRAVVAALQEGRTPPDEIG